MAAATPRDVALMIEGMRQSHLPVSFYDAHLVVRALRRLGTVDDDLVTRAVALLDHPETTDGGRGVLEDFLRALAQEQAKERALAARLISLRDSGKRARAKVGARLAIGLDAGARADAWSVTDLRGPVRLERCTPAKAAATRTDFELVLEGKGRAQLELDAPAQGRLAARRLVLDVVIE